MTNPIAGMVIRPFMQRSNAKKLHITSTQGICEEQFVSIGGIKQWVTIRGQDKTNPVLFMLHGGPGSPYTPFNSWLSEWEDHFTVVQWDQRGGGKTFQENGCDTTAPLSFDLLANDGIELAEYILNRLSKQKLLLVGSSVGSYIGLLMAHRRPGLFTTYVGTDQNSPGGWERSYELTRDAAQKSKDKKGLRVLASISENPSSWTYAQHLAMNKVAIKNTKDVPHMINDLMLPALLFAPDYKMKDIQNIEKGMNYSAGKLFEAMKSFDFDALGYDFTVPFFVLQGNKDIITPVAAARAYVDRVHAPHKGFIAISNAGHLAGFSNPHEFLQQLLKIQKSLN